MSINEWGPPTWYLFHTLAEKIKDEYFEEERMNILNQIFAISYQLPCPDCKKHAIDNLKSVNKDNIKTKEDLKLFLLEFHNKVNQQTNKPLYSKEELDKKYKYAILNNIIALFIRVWSKKSGNMHMILANSMSKNSLLKEFIHWYNKIIFKFSHEIKIK
jgi:hypothetical protein